MQILTLYYYHYHWQSTDPFVCFADILTGMYVKITITIDIQRKSAMRLQALDLVDLRSPNLLSAYKPSYCVLENDSIL